MKKFRIVTVVALSVLLLSTAAHAWKVNIENPVQCKVLADVYVVQWGTQLYKSCASNDSVGWTCEIDTGGWCPSYVDIKPDALLNKWSTKCLGTKTITVQLGGAPWTAACWNSTIEIKMDANGFTTANKK